MLTTEPFFDIDSAIAAARATRRVKRRHQAVVQFRDRLYVCDLRTDSAVHPAWTTEEDDRRAPKGKRQPYRKVDREDIPLIQALHKEGVPLSQIAKKFEVSTAPIKRALRMAV